jgi:hypothetical protein
LWSSWNWKILVAEQVNFSQQNSSRKCSVFRAREFSLAFLFSRQTPAAAGDFPICLNRRPHSRKGEPDASKEKSGQKETRQKSQKSQEVIT